MNDFDRNWCTHLVAELVKWPTTSPFRNPVDPVRDGAPNYFNIIQHPMDFSTVKRKLNSNEYSTVDSFVEDIKLICANAKKFNGETSMFGLICDDVLSEVDRQLKEKPSNSSEEWIQNLQSAIKKLNDHVNDAPIEVSQATPIPFPTDFEESSLSASQVSAIKVIIKNSEVSSLKQNWPLRSEAEKKALLSIIHPQSPLK